MDISRCTFKNGTEENEIVVVVSENGRSDVESFKDEVETSLKVPNTCTSYIIYNTYASRYVDTSWNVCNYTINIESQICPNDKITKIQCGLPLFHIQNVTKQNYTIKILTPDNTSFVAVVTFLNVTGAVFQPVEGTTVYTSSSEQYSIF